MRNKRNLPLTNKVRVESNQGNPLTSIAELKDPNLVRVQREEPNLKLNLLNNVLAKVMHELVALRDRPS
jgi:hypothetical protein